MLTAVVTFLLLIIALLAVPVTLTFQMSWQQAFQSDIRILWLFGLVRIRLHSFGPESPLPEGKERAQQSGHPGRTTHNRQHIYAAIREKSFRRRFIRYICDLWRYLHKRDVRMQIRIGLGDPADTGQLWAVAGPVAGILSNAREASIEIVPEFIDETFELDSSGNIRLVPLQMLYLTAGLLLSPSVWQGIKQMRIADQSMGTLRASEIANDSGLMLIAIESVDFRYGNTNTICRMYGKLEPIAVVVCGTNIAYALDMEAKPADLDQLIEGIPELEATITTFNIGLTDIRN